MMTKDIDCHALYTDCNYMSPRFTALHAISNSSVSQYTLQHHDQIKPSHHDTSAVTTSREYHCTLENMSGSTLQAGASKPLVLIPDATIASEIYRTR